jgi:hypothetical protein
MDVDLAAAFEQETGIALREGTLGSLTVLMPDDDRFGAFALVLGRRPEVVFPVKSYGGVHAIIWRADEKKLDKALKKITRGEA